ncbi:di-heme-cytochrome C peroxidase [Neolewinella persica]|uniref:di-heme-cytochrome C peroxidase n=1 Tax=Neolewinella persica TaxID=70998 RepID=UPI0003604F24|nr:di-heme-cytochrome C peroxidase [Neolewinella persica]
MKRFFFFALVLGTIAVACKQDPGDTNKPEKKEPEPEAYTPEDWTFFDQGWNAAKRDSFWFVTQGSRVMPYTWFAALEEPTGENPMFTPRRMDDLGYLPAPVSTLNPKGLPVGFALDTDKSTGETFVGFTCAACHTNVVKYDGKAFLVDGAPALADFVGLYDDIVTTLVSTRDDADKFDRFAHKVLADKYDDASVNQLKAALASLAADSELRQSTAALPDHYPSDFTSYGRLDAFTNIENAGSVLALDMPGNGNPAIGPVSYPFLWGTHQSDVVQWNGSASNIPRSIGPLVRNTGEVVGVFGGLKITKPEGKPKVPLLPFDYASTANFPGLIALENLVKTLKSPQWNDTNGNLPAVNPELVAQGAVLFGKTCAGCHQVVAMEDQLLNYKSKMVPIGKIGTDPTTAMIALTNVAATGILEGMKVEILDGPVMADTMPAITIPVNGVAGLLAPMLIEMMQEKSHGEINMQGHSRGVGHAQDEPTAAPNPSYKARPLNGIWATAPYLHNGSVPNLWELLKKPEDRVTEFWVGSQDFDPKNVGFITNEGKNLFKVKHQGEVMPGNSNGGHVYGTGRTDEEKWALVEYLKTL